MGPVIVSLRTQRVRQGVCVWVKTGGPSVFTSQPRCNRELRSVKEPVSHTGKRAVEGGLPSSGVLSSCLGEHTHRHPFPAHLYQFMFN